MKMKKPLISAVLMSIVVVMSLVQSGWTQALPNPAGGERPTALPLPEGAVEGEIGTIVDDLRDADDAEKTAVTKKLEAAVTKQFDRDMEYRESELSKLEERLNKLRGQLDRRRKAKAEIIQLQIKVLVNEAEGLGFGGEPLPSSYLPRGTRRTSSIGL
jgi:hypothetical protein